MKINMMMVIIAVAFFTLAGYMGTQLYNDHLAIKAGLQQCLVQTKEGTYHKLWATTCDNLIIEIETDQ